MILPDINDGPVNAYGLIQRFELTFELAWKTLKDLFYKEGLTGLNSPKTILREAFPILQQILQVRQ